MFLLKNTAGKDIIFNLAIVFLLITGIIVLYSISRQLFPSYFVYIVLGILAYIIFSNVDFEVLRLFSKHFYVLGIVFLLITLIIGQATRGTIRWIPIGGFSFQPAELARPFFILFFADFLARRAFNLKHFYKALVLLLLPTLLILIQPSLSVAILTIVGFIGVLIANDFDKKYILVGLLVVAVTIPFFWLILRPYQKARIQNFMNPESDPYGAGYNSIQSMIAVGSGQIYGRSLGKGVQTQLAFLPERQTDFVFASASEELGFFGAIIILFSATILFWRLTVFMENSVNPIGRSYLSGIFLSLLVQVFVHTGMNMGLLPVAGLPFPLVSAGGSSLLSTMIGLGISMAAYNKVGAKYF